ncbi:PQQ-dependent catabolism-associated CXXCW motif protein [Yoonia maritima]|uniref:PQQ-dependent catabolism-associated CXXCW motif protein n=1 Tax=Yoonia maritima TaxID=1435347 RepID=UPI003736C1D1
MIRAATLALVLMMPLPCFAQSVAEPDGYRTEQYRAPVPATLAGGTVVDVDEAYALWMAGDVTFIDVLPRAPKPKDLPEGTVWREQPRLSIPGATWLPNVGYGQLAQETVTYFEEGLAKATDGNKEAPVVFFCLSECWMSWNAAKRAVDEFGYNQVYWFPDGTDVWTMASYPTEEIEPE